MKKALGRLAYATAKELLVNAATTLGTNLANKIIKPHDGASPSETEEKKP